MTATASQEYRFTRIDVETLPLSNWHRGAMLIEWDAEEIGSGQLFVYTALDGTMKADDETTARAFVEALLAEVGRRVALEY